LAPRSPSARLGSKNRGSSIIRRSQDATEPLAFGDLWTQHDGTAEREARAVLETTKLKADGVIRQKIPTPQKAMAPMRIEKSGRDKIAEIKRSVAITKPRGIGLSRALAHEWSSYSIHRGSPLSASVSCRRGISPSTSSRSGAAGPTGSFLTSCSLAKP
jgi:hypothetical protein